MLLNSTWNALKFNSNVRLLFSKLLVVRQAAEETYLKGNHAEVLRRFRRVSLCSALSGNTSFSKFLPTK